MCIRDSYNTSTTQTTRDASYLSCYEKYSERAVITKETTGDFAIASNDQLIFTYNGTTVSDVTDMISNANGTAAYTYINYDFRSLNGGSNDPNYYLNFTIGDDSYGTAAASNRAGAQDGHVASSVYNTGLIGTALLNAPGAKLQYADHLTSTQALTIIVNMKPISGTLGDKLSAGKSYPCLLYTSPSPRD